MESTKNYKNEKVSLAWLLDARSIYKSPFYFYKQKHVELEILEILVMIASKYRYIGKI